jgi:hypothetical protein
VPGPDVYEPTKDSDLIPGSARHPRKIEFLSKPQITPNQLPCNPKPPIVAN